MGADQRPSPLGCWGGSLRELESQDLRSQPMTKTQKRTARRLPQASGRPHSLSRLYSADEQLPGSRQAKRPAWTTVRTLTQEASTGRRFSAARAEAL